MYNIKVKHRKCTTTGGSKGFIIPKALIDSGIVKFGSYYDITLKEVPPPNNKKKNNDLYEKGKITN